MIVISPDVLGLKGIFFIMDKKRVCNLRKGEVFKWMGTSYMVTSIRDMIYFKMLDSYNYLNGYPYSFGRKNQMWVQLITEK